MADRDKLLDEAASLLNRGESISALKTLRQFAGLVNVWQCESCNYQSDATTSAGCPMCSGDMKAVVVREREHNTDLKATHAHPEKCAKCGRALVGAPGLEYCEACEVPKDHCQMMIEARQQLPT